MAAPPPRKETQTRAPAAGADFRQFPVHRLALGTTFYRAHSALPPERAAQPWWFSSDGGGRFDLVTPQGTCYLAATPAAAAREIVGPALAQNRYIPHSLTKDRVVSEVQLPRPVRAAMLTSKHALLFGCVGSELSVTSDYALTQAWASALSASGFTGIWYQPRFSAPRQRALAVFGAAGVHAGTPIAATHLTTVCLELGYQVLLDPPRGALTILE